MKDFIEYTDNGDMYMYRETKRHEASEVIEIRIYCAHEGCNKYIVGNEGYNGKFIAETGQQADLRNECWFCKKHEPENIEKSDTEVSLNVDPTSKKPDNIKLSRYEEAILLVLYEAHPIPIHRAEIMKKINEKGLLKMSKEEFEKYKEIAKLSKKN
jgi:hypothetical protein